MVLGLFEAALRGKKIQVVAVEDIGKCRFLFSSTAEADPRSSVFLFPLPSPRLRRRRSPLQPRPLRRAAHQARGRLTQRLRDPFHLLSSREEGGVEDLASLGGDQSPSSRLQDDDAHVWGEGIYRGY